ncbi:hypothetical protein CMUS01_13969 [Colletotrichum musicola]|uniref:Uncharacterized protein n=1 Tax=Colletotrichum musicola TaxID=2175873 RepID=A0A8H6J7Y5_9PEZI|nr:hypothetical protein CMUS01_13969 [Colletotrichum musicola]
MDLPVLGASGRFARSDLPPFVTSHRTIPSLPIHTFLPHTSCLHRTHTDPTCIGLGRHNPQPTTLNGAIHNHNPAATRTHFPRPTLALALALVLVLILVPRPASFSTLDASLGICAAPVEAIIAPAISHRPTPPPSTRRCPPRRPTPPCLLLLVFSSLALALDRYQWPRSPIAPQLLFLPSAGLRISMTWAWHGLPRLSKATPTWHMSHTGFRTPRARREKTLTTTLQNGTANMQISLLGKTKRHAMRERSFVASLLADGQQPCLGISPSTPARHGATEPQLTRTVSKDLRALLRRTYRSSIRSQLPCHNVDL